MASAQLLILPNSFTALALFQHEMIFCGGHILLVQGVFFRFLVDQNTALFYGFWSNRILVYFQYTYLSVTGVTSQLFSTFDD